MGDEEMEEHEEMEEESTRPSNGRGSGDFHYGNGRQYGQRRKGFNESQSCCCEGDRVLIESTNSVLWVGLSRSCSSRETVPRSIRAKMTT